MRGFGRRAGIRKGSFTFAHIAEQRGMFSYTGLSPLQVKRLREEFSVYMVGSGRANVAGLDATRLDQLASAIAQVSL